MPHRQGFFLALFLAFHRGQDQDTAKAARIVLKPLKEVSLPPGERVRGIAAREDGSIAFWSRATVWVALPSHAIRPVCESRGGQVISAFFVDSQSVGTLESHSHQVLRSTGNGWCVPWFRAPVLVGSVLDAVWQRNNLLVLSKEPFRPLVLNTIDTMGRTRSTHRVNVDQGLIDTFEWVYLSRSDRGALIGTHRLPAWWMILDQRPVRSSGISPKQLSQAGIKATTEELYASAVIRCGGFFAQTITDLTRGTRYQAVYDGAGRLLRLTKSPQDVALVASLPGDTILLGLRRPKPVLVFLARAR